MGSTGTVPGHYRGSTRTVHGHYMGNTGTLQGQYPDITKAAPGQYRGSTGTVPGHYKGSTRTVPGQYQDSTWTLKRQYRDMAANDHFISRHLQVNIHYPPYHSIRGGQTDQFQNPHSAANMGHALIKTRHFFSFFMASYICSSLSILQRPSLSCTKPPPPSQQTCATRVVATPCPHPELPATSLNKSQTSAHKYSHTLFRTNVVSNPEGTVCHP